MAAEPLAYPPFLSPTLGPSHHPLTVLLNLPRTLELVIFHHQVHHECLLIAQILRSRRETCEAQITWLLPTSLITWS